MKTDFSNAKAAAKVTALTAFVGMQQVTALVVKVAAARSDQCEPAGGELIREVIQAALVEFEGAPFVVVACEPSAEGPAWSMVPRDDLNRPVFTPMARRRIAKELRIPEAHLRYAAVPFYAAPRTPRAEQTAAQA